MSQAAFALLDWLSEPAETLRLLLGGIGLGVLVGVGWVVPPPGADDDPWGNW